MVIRWAGIYGENLNTQNPEFALLAQLLQIKGNDAYSDPFWSHDVEVRIGELGTTDQNGKLITVIEVPLAPPDNILPSKLQLMLLLFEVGAAQ
jgi:hypothetical protein